MVLNPGTADEREVNPVGESIEVKAEDLLRVETCGGGGWGDPARRTAEARARDVRDGIVSARK